MTNYTWNQHSFNGLSVIVHVLYVFCGVCAVLYYMCAHLCRISGVLCSAHCVAYVRFAMLGMYRCHVLYYCSDRSACVALLCIVLLLCRIRVAIDTSNGGTPFLACVAYIHELQVVVVRFDASCVHACCCGMWTGGINVPPVVFATPAFFFQVPWSVACFGT